MTKLLGPLPRGARLVVCIPFEALLLVSHAHHVIIRYSASMLAGHVVSLASPELNALFYVVRLVTRKSKKKDRNMFTVYILRVHQMSCK